jgi:hypothetical protein
MGNIHLGPVLAPVDPLVLDNGGALEDGAVGGEALERSL